MANDLVPIYRKKSEDDADDEETKWDLPPVSGAPRSGETAARKADHEAAQAERRGDDTFATVRRADAKENRQARWDWGDRSTWLLIAALFFFGLVIVAIAYVLPQGRTATQPIIHIY